MSRVVPQFMQEAAADGVDISLPKPIDVDNVIKVVARMTDPVPMVAR